MSELVGEAVIELRGDTDRLDDDIRRSGSKFDKMMKGIRSGWASMGDQKVDVDTKPAESALTRLRLSLFRFASTRTVHEVDVDTDGASRGVGRMTSQLVQMAGVIRTAWIPVAAGLSPGLIPILATATAAAASLTNGLVAAGGAAGIFALAVGGQVARMKDARTELDKLHKKVQDTKKGTEEHTAAVKEYAAAQKQWTQTFGPAAAGMTALTSAWDRFLSLTERVTLDVMGRGLQFIADLLPRLAPIANVAGRAIGGLLAELTLWSQGPGMTRLLAFFQREGPRYITSFGHIASNVIQGVVSLFAAFLPITGNVVGGLEQMTARFRDWAATVSRSQGFQSFIDYVQTNGPRVLSFFGNLFDAVVSLVDVLAPIGSVIVSELSDSFAVLSSVIDVVDTVFDAVRDIVSGRGSEVMARLAAAFQAGWPIVQGWLAALPGRIFTAMGDLGVFLIEKGRQAIIGLYNGFVAAMPQIFAFFQSLPGRIAGMLTGLVSWAVANGPRIIQGLVTGMRTAVPLVTALILALPVLITVALGAAVAAMVIAGAGLMAGLVRGIAAQVPVVLGFVRSLPGRIIGALAALGGMLAGLAGRAFAAFLDRARAGTNNAVSLLRGLPGRAAGAAAALVGRLASLAGNAMNALRSRISAGVNNAVALLRSLPGRAGSAAAGMTGRLAAVASAAFSAMVGRTRAGVSAVVGVVASLAGRVRGAAAGAGGWLVGAGQAIISGLIGGIRSMAGSVASAARSVVQSAISAARSALKIGSPSKVFHRIGIQTIQGYVGGLAENRDVVNKTLDRVFSGIRRFAKEHHRTAKWAAAQIRDLGDEARAMRLNADARQRLNDRMKATVDIGRQIASSIVEQNNLSTIQAADEKTPLTAADVVTQMRARLTAVRRFAADLAVLRRRGLNQAALQDIAGAGPQQSGALATVLAKASTAQLRALNTAQAQIRRYAGSTGQTAVAGIVAGLTSQLDAVDAAGVRIARRLRTAIRRELKIKSPSQVFHEIGVQVGAGFIAGMDAMRAGVELAGRRMATAATPAASPYGPPGLAGIGPGSIPRGMIAGVSAGNTATINVNLPTGDPEAAAAAVASRWVLAGVAG